MRADRAISDGRKCLAQRDLAGASAHFTEAVRTAPESWHAYYWAGCSAAHQGEYAAAHGHFTRALGLSPANGKISVQRGYISIRRGDFASALEDLRAALQRDALDDAGRLALSAMELRLGDPGQARQPLNMVSRAGLQDYSEALADAGGAERLSVLLLLLADERDTAARLLARLSRKRPADTGLLHMRGVALLHTLRSLDDATAAEPLWRECIAVWGRLLMDDLFWSGWKTRAEQRYRSVINAGTLAKTRDGIRGLVENSLPAGTPQLMLRRELEAARLLRQVGGFPLPRQDGTFIIGGPLLIAELGLHREFGVFATEAEQESRAPSALLRAFSALGTADCLLREERPEEAVTAAADLRCDDCRTRPASPEPMICGPACERFACENPALAGRPDGRAWLAAEARSVLREALQRAARISLAAPDPEASVITSHWRRTLALAGRSLRALTQEDICDQALGRARTLRASDRSGAAIDLLEQTRWLLGASDQRRIDWPLAGLLNNRGVAGLNADSRSSTALDDLRRATKLNPRNRRMWLNRLFAEDRMAASAGAFGGSSAADQLSARRARQTLDSALTEAVRHLPGDEEIRLRWHNFTRLRVSLELKAAEASRARGDFRAAWELASDTALAAQEAERRFPDSVELAELARKVNVLLGLLRRST